LYPLANMVNAIRIDGKGRRRSVQG